LGRGVLTGTYGDRPAVSPYVEERRTERAARIVQAVLTAAEGSGRHRWPSPWPGCATDPAWRRRSSAPATPRSWGGLMGSRGGWTLPAEIRAGLDDVSAEG
jgi:hypothetical protein